MQTFTAERKSLRVAIVTASTGFGGAEKQMYYQARSLIGVGAQVRLFSFMESGVHSRALHDYGVETEVLGDNRTVRLARLIRALMSFRPNVIQSIHAYTNVYSAIAGKIVGAVSIGGLREDVDRHFRSNPRFGRHLLRATDAIIVNSLRALNQLCARKIIDASRCYYLPNVIDLTLPPMRSREDSAACTCISAGRLIHSKRFDLFLEALAAARKEGSFLRGVIAGDGPEAQSLLDLSELLGLTPNEVSFPGMVSNLQSALAQGDIFLLCSESEGTPNVVIEAMAAGMPVITTPAGDAADLVRQAKAGIVVPFGDLKALVSAITLLARAPSLRVELGESGRRYIARHHNAADLAGRLLAVYAQAAQSQQNRGSEAVNAIQSTASPGTLTSRCDV